MKNTKSCNRYMWKDISCNAIHSKHKYQKCDLCGFEVFGYNIYLSLNLFFSEM